MADCMSFPDTMNEFLEQYSFKDTDEVYTNGSELIQVIRVKQGLEHYEAEIRAKAIEEFAERLRQECLKSPYKEVWLHTMLKISKEMKGE